MEQKNLVYVGTYTEPILFGTGQVLQGKGEGIHCLRLRPRCRHADPAFRRPRVSAIRPTCASIATAAHLYCVNEFKEYEGKPSGAVSAFRIDQKTGALTWLNSRPSHGTDPCHLVIDPSGRYVLIANFASGSTCVLPILGDGSLGDETDWVQHEGRASIPGGRPARTPMPSPSPPTAASPTSPTSGSTR